MEYYIYFLTNSTKSVLYVGVTNNLQRRLEEHKSETGDGFTKQYHVTKLVYAEKFGDIRTAIKREKQIKSWSRQRKNELIESVNKKWKEILPF